MFNVCHRLTLLLFIFFSCFDAHARLVYSSTGQGQLIELNLATNQMINRGSISGAGNPSMFLSDIAISPNGELFGADGNHRLWRIDRHTAIATLIGQLSYIATGLAFHPDGRLFGAGYSSGSNAFIYEIDPMSAMTSVVATIPVPSGDIVFDRVTGLVYVSTSVSGGDALFEVNIDTGVSQMSFSLSPNYSAWGLAILPDQTLIAGFSAGAVRRYSKTANSWGQGVVVANIPNGITGMADFSCRTQANLKINGQSESVAHIKCGDGLIVSGQNSTEAVLHRWDVDSTDEAGQPIHISVPAQGLHQAGPPDHLNLRYDPQFDALKIYKNRVDRVQLITVKLTTWCDATEVPSVKTVQIYVDPLKFSWGMNPSDAIINAGIEMRALDTGTEIIQQQTWKLNEQVVSNANEYRHYFSRDHLGNQYLTYRVDHQNGCFSEETRGFKIEAPEWFMPNSFTPNGDGLNDTFGPLFSPSHPFVEIEMMIYNRWGNLVYQSKVEDRSGFWDGTTSSGDLAPQGSYQVTLRLRHRTNGWQVFGAAMNLIR